MIPLINPQNMTGPGVVLKGIMKGKKVLYDLPTLGPNSPIKK